LSKLPGMRHIESGRFQMGSDRHYPEEAPAHLVEVDGFWIDETPVTNRQFAAFVDATGYVTFAERPPNPADYPGMAPEMARAGSLVFMPPTGPPRPVGPGDWWTFSFGADWRHPLGPGSDLKRKGDHPVTHVAYCDAEAYAAWAGKTLPTEAEWEFAARGGLDAAAFAWGDQLAPAGRMLANYWQGPFPWRNLKLDGHERTSPVRSFPPNGYGLHDMIGNVWEWTSDWYAGRHPAPTSPCCAPRNPHGAAETDSIDPAFADLGVGRKVMKGGSHLCAENYCQRYRPAARHPQPIDTTTSHLGFRCISRTHAG